MNHLTRLCKSLSLRATGIVTFLLTQEVCRPVDVTACSLEQLIVRRLLCFQCCTYCLRWRFA